MGFRCPSRGVRSLGLCGWIRAKCGFEKEGVLLEVMGVVHSVPSIFEDCNSRPVAGRLVCC